MNQRTHHPAFTSEVRGVFMRGALGLFLIVLVLAACTSGSMGLTSGPTSGASGTAPAASATSLPSPNRFPATVVDDEGTAVTIPSEPKRIVTLTAAATETAFALGLGDRVVATDGASDYPAAALALPHVGQFGSVDVEKIVGAAADLVIAGGNGETPPDGIQRLRLLHVPVVVVYAHTIEAVYGDIKLIGRAAGADAAAESLASTLKGDITALAAAVSSASRPRVFYEVDATSAIYGPADQSFLTEMLIAAGADPITSGSKDSYEISLERLVAADPQVIILGDAAYGVTLATVRARAGWGVMSAVRTGDVRPADDKLITRPGPRLAEGLRSLILAVHPDAKLP